MLEVWVTAEVDAGGWVSYVEAWDRRERELMTRWKAQLPGGAVRMRWIGHEHIRETLEELADESVQRRLWTATGGEVSSLSEAISRLYDDSALVLELEAGREVYSPDIDQMLSDLLPLLKKIDQRRPAEDILQDPRMATVRRRAGVILREIDARGKQP